VPHNIKILPIFETRLLFQKAKIELIDKDWRFKHSNIRHLDDRHSLRTSLISKISTRFKVVYEYFNDGFTPGFVDHVANSRKLTELSDKIF
jgi:hypothetical protein